MANSSKIQKYAPYSKKVLIPLWTIQLGLTLLLLIETLLSFSWPHPFYLNPSTTALEVFIAIFSFFLTASIIYIIIKFARLTLSTSQFLKQAIVALVLSVVMTIMLLATMNWFMGIFAGLLLLMSIWQGTYVWRVRRRVKRGMAGEMKRGAKEVEGGTELESGNLARVVVQPVGAKAVPSIAVTVDLRSKSSRPRRSLNSVAMDVETTGPPKDIREFF